MGKNRNLSIRIDQRKVPIRIKRNRASKSINLSIHPLTQCIHLTIPKNVSLYLGLNYLKSQRAWLRNELKELAVEGWELFDGNHLIDHGLIKLKSNIPKLD